MNDKNIVWQAGKVTRETRYRVMGQNGLVVWFTGLSGAGKSTIAVETEKLLYKHNVKAYLLDGDNLRHGINSDLGFSDSDRNENIRRVSEIAKLFCDAGMVTLVSFISPFREMREKARQLIGSEQFIEVYVNADISTCAKRDPKGLYAKNIEQFTGVDSAYEEPINPDFILDTEQLSVREATLLIFNEIIERLGTDNEVRKRT